MAVSLSVSICVRIGVRLGGLWMDPSINGHVATPLATHGIPPTLVRCVIPIACALHSNGTFQFMICKRWSSNTVNKNGFNINFPLFEKEIWHEQVEYLNF